MQWKDCPGGLHQYNTGGSSGEPLIFYFDRRRQACDAASRALYHLWWGCDIGDKELYFWGSPVEETRQDRIKSFRDRITNELLISAFDVSEAVVPEYAEVFRKFRPKCLYAYPSTLSLFCEMAKRQNVRLDEVGVAGRVLHGRGAVRPPARGHLRVLRRDPGGGFLRVPRGGAT